jgi:hypothetical protein
MKTLREVLLERYRQAEPRLDEVRRRALAELTQAGSTEALGRSCSEGLLKRRVDDAECGILKKIWLELIWPSRGAWAGMAALWLGLLAANFGMKATATTSTAARSAHRGELVQAIEEQRRLLAELLPATKPQPAEPPRPGSRPRSQRVVPFKNC